MGNCPYCLDKDVHVVDIGCSHLFCTKCCSNLVKITKIKKGLNFSKLEGSLGPGQSQGLQVIKCPKCSLINMLSNSKMEEILSVTDYDRAKREKHQSIKSKGEIKCMLCTTKKVQVAVFECLNCENTFLCDYCRQKHLKNARYKNHKVAAL